jgi:SAM-dependent methyltransferase
VDLNGEDGALVRDLARPGSIEDLGHFDVVTNFGTTEHVPDQVVVWRQVHNAVKPGGWLISTTPSPGTWQGHGAWYPMLDWYCEFGIQNHYRTRMIGRFVVPGPNRQLNVYVAQREEHPGPWHEFQMPDAGLMRRNDEGHVGDYSADFVVTSSTGEPPRYSKYQQILRALTATLPGMDAHETALAYVRGVDAIVRAKPGPPTD